jgi:hypothetical protein
MKYVHFFVYLVNPGHSVGSGQVKSCMNTVSNVEYGAEEKGMDEERQYQLADMCLLHLE